MDEPFSFRAGVRREVSATWGRFHMIWIPLAIVAAFLLLGLQGPSGHVLAMSLASALVWGSAWLCSDLLSLKFEANPEPLREWRPVEFLARAVGRLLPLYTAGLVWSMSYTGRLLVEELSREGTIGFGSVAQDRPDLWAAMPARVLLPLACGLLLASNSALLSSIFRRPSRPVLTLTQLVLHTCANTALYLAFNPLGADYTRSAFLAVAGVPNIMLSMITVAKMREVLAAAGVSGVGEAGMSWLAVLSFVLPTVPFVLWTWWIAARRWRRHPHTAGTVSTVARKQ